VPLDAALAMPVSLAFIKHGDNSIMTTNVQSCAGISHIQDLVKYHEQRQIRVKDMKIHQWLRKALAQGDI
jgi:hypothetical protein